jgi:hypothetical protein
LLALPNKKYYTDFHPDCQSPFFLFFTFILSVAESPPAGRSFCAFLRQDAPPAAHHLKKARGDAEIRQKNARPFLTLPPL